MKKEDMSCIDCAVKNCNKMDKTYPDFCLTTHTVSYTHLDVYKRQHPNIREIREQRGIYQDDLAAAIGFSTKTVGRIERGDSTPSAEFMLRRCV